MLRRLSACMIVVGALAGLGAARDRSVAYRLSPEFRDGALQALDVEVSFRATDDRTEFRWIDNWAGDDRTWRCVRDLQVEGARNVFAEGRGRWRIDAPRGAALVVRYRVVSALDHDPTAEDNGLQSKPIIRPSWFYAVGEALFGAPADREDAPASFEWTGDRSGIALASDLQHLAGPHRRATRPGTVNDVRESIALGGRHLWTQGKRTGVRIAGVGEYRFPHEAFESLVARIITTERGFWSDGSRAPFLVTMAPVAPLPGTSNSSGAGRTDAFALWFDQSLPLSDATGLLAHEYFHTWNPRELGGLADGSDEPAGYWFSEGFTDYYTRRMALASGAWTLEDFAGHWTKALRDYDLSRARTMPNAVVVRDFWKDPEVQHLPYLRGSVLAALLDARLRAEHPGKGGLDALMWRQWRRAAAGDRGGSVGPGETGTAAALFLAVLADASPASVTEMDKVVEGGAMVRLPADAFAPCFVVTTRSEVTFDRGFDIAATMRNGHKVTGLEPGGPAQRAGLREGMHIAIDETTEPDPFTARTYVVLGDDGSRRTIRYLPLGAPAELQSVQVAAGLDAVERTRCVRLYGARPNI